MKPLVIYHYPCIDGWTAAWAVALAHGGPEHVDMLAANYDHTAPDVTDRDVTIVDFSYPREDLIRMHGQASSLLVLDHHKSAAKDLEGLDFAVFDMERSGAMMAWAEFHSDPAPALVRYVQDRDLWTKKLHRSAEVSAALSTYPLDYPTWTMLHHTMKKDPVAIVNEGVAVLRYIDKIVDIAVESASWLSLSGEPDVVRGVPCDPLIRSDVGSKLLDGADTAYSVTWRESSEGFVYSLRSRDDRADVSVIAKRFGGGGHRNAAGFKVESSRHIWGIGIPEEY